LTWRVRVLPAPEDQSAEVEASHRIVLELAGRALTFVEPEVQMLLGQLLTSVTDPLRIVYLFGSILGLDLERAQALLEAPTRLRALRLMGAYLMHEVQALELRQHIADQARTEINQQQREYLLRQQLRAIQAELGEQNLEQAEARSLRQRFEAADLPEETRQEAERELARLEKMSAASPDYHIGR